MTDTRSLRIVSLSPSMTETLFAIGAGHLLVGRSKQCNFPPEALKVPAVSDFSEPNLEAILGQMPTLVVGPKGPATGRLEAPLRERKIDSCFESPESIRDIEALFGNLGARTKHEEDATRVLGQCQRTLQATAKAVAALQKPRVAMLLSTKPIYLAGPASFPGDLVTLAGATHVANVPVPYPAVNIEQLAGWDPDTLIDATNMAGGAGVHAGLPGFGLLRAVREKRIVPINDDRVLRPGPRFAEGVRVLAQALHPGVLQNP